MDWWDKWKIFVSKIKDEHPADGLKPIDPKVYDIHPGGPTAEDFPPLTTDDYLNAPLEKLQKYARPPKGRPVIEYEPVPWDTDVEARGRADLPQPPREPRYDSEAQTAEPNVEELVDKWNVQNRELTWLEASNTVSQHQVDMHRERMEDFRKVLAHADTIDIDLFHLNKEINDIEGSIRALKTKV
jgi:hypothetical protein